MDLYIQIGVLLLMLSALSLFIYFYTQPADMFSKGISEKTEEISAKMADIKDKDLQQLLYAQGISGKEIKNLIHKAEAKQISVLVQTTNQAGAIVNYGPQLKSVYDTGFSMGMSASDKPTGSYPYDSYYVTTVKAVFFENNPSTVGTARIGSADTMPANINLYNSISTNPDLPPAGSTAHLVATNNAKRYYNFPKLSGNPQNKSINASLAKGEATSLTGFFYTDNVPKIEQVNRNVSYMETKNSVFYIPDNASFNTTLIKGTNEDIVGVYVEQSDVALNAGVLRQLMSWTGLN